MPGIYGTVGAEPTPDIATLSGTMAARMKHHTWYREGHHLDIPAGVVLGQVSLGYGGVAPRPFRCGESGLLGVMEGEVYDWVGQTRPAAVPAREACAEGAVRAFVQGFECGGREFLAG